MRALRRYKLHQLYLYQISHLLVKRNLQTNYATIHAFSVRLCKNAKLFTCALMLLRLLSTKNKSRNNGDEGSRTLISAMRPRRAPVTPRPLNCPFDAILHDCFQNSKSFLSPVAPKLRTAISHSRESFLSAHALAPSDCQPDNQPPSAQL